MANTIEILIKARDEASRVLQSSAASAGGLAGSFAKIGVAAGVIGGVATAVVGLGAAVFNAGKSLADYAEQLGNVAVRTGATVQQVQVLRQTLINAGLGADAANQALTFLNRAIATQDPLLRALGITTTNAYDAMLQLGDAFAASSDTAAKNEISMQLLGRSGAQLIPVLEGLRGKTAEVKTIFDETGATLTDETIKKLADLDARTDEFATRWEGFMTRVKGSAADAALNTLDAFESLKRGLSDFASGKFAAGGLQSLKRFGAAPSPFGVGAEEAAKATAAADAVSAALAAARKKAGESAKAAAKDVETLAEALAKAGLIADSVRDKFAIVTPATFGDAKPKFGLGVPALPQPVEPNLGAEMAKFGKEAQDQLREFETALLSVQNVASEVAFAIEGAISQAIGQFVQKIKLFGSEANSFFQSVLSSLLSFVSRIMAQLAAYGLFKLLSFMGGPVGAFFGLAAGAASPFGAAATGPSGRVSGSGTGGRTVERSGAALERASGPAAPMATLTREDLVSAFREALQSVGPRLGGSGGDTFNISALDFKNVYDSIMSPGGAQRRANDRLAELAAVA